MQILIKDIKEADCACDALILPFTEGDSGLYNHLPPSLAKLVRKSFSKEFRGKHNEVLLIPAPEDIKPERILLTGLGKKDEFTQERARQVGGRAGVYLRDRRMKSIALSSEVLSANGVSPADFIEGFLLGTYKFHKYIHEKEKNVVSSIAVLSKVSKELKQDIQWSETVAASVNFARDLVNTPANDMTPTHLAKAALSLKRKNLSVKIVERKDAMRLGMGAYLSVARGSGQPAKFIILEYRTSKKPPIVLIGKSITFDSGGLSLKPAEGMEKMKYDMAGGAAVLGIMKAVSALEMPVDIVGILPATENLPGGSATRPGDVVRSITGKTIEIISTDAEGRMTLADAIGFAKRFRPRAIIDIATLTGACAIAFGNCAIAMMGNKREILDKMKECGYNTYERVWEMPLFDECKEYLKSDIADLKNAGGKTASLLSSAAFLSEFAGDVPWAHLDIAGTAWVEKEKPYVPKGASGIGTRLILNFIKELK